jgi:hypothetical protein
MRSTARKATEEHDPDGFKFYIMSGDVNGQCKKCGAIATFEYVGLDSVYPEFRLVCDGYHVYQRTKIRMFPRHLSPEPYRGRRLFERWHMKHGRWQ